MASIKVWVDLVRVVMEAAERDGVDWNGVMRLCEEPGCPGHPHDVPQLFMRVEDDE